MQKLTTALCLSIFQLVIRIPKGWGSLSPFVGFLVSQPNVRPKVFCPTVGDCFLGLCSKTPIKGPLSEGTRQPSLGQGVAGQQDAIGDHNRVSMSATWPLLSRGGAETGRSLHFSFIFSNTLCLLCCLSHGL